MVHMIFTNLDDAQGCLDQINLNKKYIPPQTVDNLHEWFNINHEDYLAGGRYSFMKPTGGGKPSRWLANLEKFKWTEKEEDTTWYDKIFPEEEPEL